MSIGYDAEISVSDCYGEDEDGASAGMNFYPSKSVGIGISIDFTSYDDCNGSTATLYFDYFVINDLALNVSYSVDGQDRVFTHIQFIENIKAFIRYYQYLADPNLYE